MSPAGLGLAVRKLIRKTQGGKTGVKSNPIQVDTTDGVASVQLVVTPVHTPGREPEFLVTIEESPDGAGAEKNRRRNLPRKGVAPQIRQLEEELARTREYLQVVIEEHEAATEELKSAHEEVQSGNEELQSTNEELLTAKEELQSTNEELTTVNEEMYGRNSELQQVNNDLLNLLSSVTIPIVMLGNDLRIRRFTPQAEKILNLLATDVGRPISDFRLKISVPDLAEVCQDVIDSLTPKEREVLDVEGRAYSMWIRPYRTVENRIDGVVLALFDITEQKQSAEARYRLPFEASPDGIVIADAKSLEIVDVNPFITKVFGYPRGQLIGVKFGETDLFRGTSLDESVIGLLPEQASVRKTASLSSVSREIIECEIVCNCYAEAKKTVIQFNIRDISARKRMEEQFRREEDVLRQGQKMDAVGRLAGSVAHDFNNWLTTILGYCDLLGPELKNGGKAFELVSEIRDSADKAAALTRGLLVFGGRHPAEKSVIDLNTVITEMQPLVATVMNEDVRIELDFSADGCVDADRNKLEQVILSLVLNAKDSMPDGGKIILRVAEVNADESFSRKNPGIPPGAYMLVSVKDTGAGMDAETRSHMFEPFFTTKAGDNGLGLDLSTTYNIVRQNNGYITVSSELGLGTTVCVYLPKVKPGERSDSTAEPVGGSETIMVVENNASVRGLSRRFLERRGYQVLEAVDGPEALRVAREHPGAIHLLLTNVVMPYMSGREVAFQLERERPDMKVVYMSGDLEDTIAPYGILSDRRLLLQKPFTEKTLAGKVRDALDR
jgi:PAS domain S-box-containing protein